MTDHIILTELNGTERHLDLEGCKGKTVFLASLVPPDAPIAIGFDGSNHEDTTAVVTKCPRCST